MDPLPLECNSEPSTPGKTGGVGQGDRAKVPCSGCSQPALRISPSMDLEAVVPTLAWVSPWSTLSVSLEMFSLGSGKAPTPIQEPGVTVSQMRVIVRIPRECVKHCCPLQKRKTGTRGHALAACHTTLEGQRLQTLLVFCLRVPPRFKGIGAECTKCPAFSHNRALPGRDTEGRDPSAPQRLVLQLLTAESQVTPVS